MRISDWSSDVCSSVLSCPHSCRSLKTSTSLLRGKTQTELGLRASSVFERDLQPDGPRRRVEEKLAGLVQKERRCRIHIVENVPCEEVHRNMVVERREPDIAIDDRVAVIRERAEEVVVERARIGSVETEGQA